MDQELKTFWIVLALAFSAATAIPRIQAVSATSERQYRNGPYAGCNKDLRTKIVSCPKHLGYPASLTTFALQRQTAMAGRTCYALRTRATWTGTSHAGVSFFMVECAPQSREQVVQVVCNPQGSYCKRF